MTRGRLARMDRPYTIADYVRLEEQSPIKHEYIRGEIRVMPGAIESGGDVHAMGGGTIEHARIAIAVATAIMRQLEGRRCAVFSSDARVRISASDVATYPDLVICCGSVEQDPDDRLAIANPTAVVEITSLSTERYDRGGKLDLYKLVPSLRDIVIVGHRERSIEVHHREVDSKWTVTNASTGEQVRVLSVDCALDVDAVYHDPFAAS